MQNSAGVRRVRCTTCTALPQFSGKSGLRLAARLRDVGVWKWRKILRENARTCCKFYPMLGHCACRTRLACAACVAQHARRCHSSRGSQGCVWRRDCAMSAFGNGAKFCEKTRELAANFIQCWGTAHAELGWRAPRALHNMHGVATVLGEVRAAFGGEIARCRRLEMAQNFARKVSENARTCCKFCRISVHC